MVLHDILHDILSWESPQPFPPEFRFEWSNAAAQHNLDVLRRYHLNLDRAIRVQPFSSVTIGSEFRPVSVLAPLCGAHPLWHRVRRSLTDGTSWQLEPISEEDRLHDLGAIVRRGNHKSAIVNQEKVVQILKDEVKHMWQLPLPPRALLELPDTVVAPLGLSRLPSCRSSPPPRP